MRGPVPGPPQDEDGPEDRGGEERQASDRKDPSATHRANLCGMVDPVRATIAQPIMHDSHPRRHPASRAGGHFRSRCLALVAFSLFLARGAAGASSVVAPAGGGLAALEVKVDLGGSRVEANGHTLAIPLEHGRLPPEAEVTVEDVAIGQGRHVVHVRVPSHDESGAGGVAWEAILAAGRTDPIFAGVTGLVSGDPGERVGQAVQIVPGDETSYVLVGDIREDLSLCGQTTTLLDPRALYPASLELRPATVQRLGADQRASAQKIVATPASAASAAETPLARLLVSRGSSVPDSRGAELTDGAPQTVWREQRPGVGQGEFVVMAAPKGVPITRMRIVPAPPGPEGARACAAPKTFYVVTSARTFEVELPIDGCIKGGSAFDVALPEPIDSECVAIVLDSSFARVSAHPDVGIAEVTAFSEFDAPGATLDDVAARLSSDQGIGAAQVLERAGDAALPAVARAYDALDARGRALAIDVAASHEKCEDAAGLLARGLCETTGQAPRRAREKLERCKAAAPALAQRLREDAPSRSCVAPVLAMIAPGEALVPIADAIGATDEANQKTRAALRAAFGVSLKVAPPGELAALLRDPNRSAASRLEMMRAAERRVVEAPSESAATVSQLFVGAPAPRLRYLVLGPLGELAHAGDRASAARLADMMANDAEWPVRARAAEQARGLADAADLQGALVAAVRDPEPRVREAALAGLVESPPPDGVRAASEVLAHDGWSFVKVQAVGVLMNAPPSSGVDDALGHALGDPAARVRTAAVLGLARRRAASWRDAIRERLDDRDEDPEVRATAATALGGLCDGSAAGRLTELARLLSMPGIDEDAQQVGFGALVGLAALKPKNLQDRLGPLLAPGAPPEVRAAATRALAARGTCRW